MSSVGRLDCDVTRALCGYRHILAAGGLDTNPASWPGDCGERQRRTIASDLLSSLSRLVRVRLSRVYGSHGYYLVDGHQTCRHLVISGW